MEGAGARVGRNWILAIFLDRAESVFWVYSLFSVTRDYRAQVFGLQGLELCTVISARREMNLDSLFTVQRYLSLKILNNHRSAYLKYS